MPLTPESTPSGPSGLGFSKLWIYTNYDCNLRCSYCLAESAPGAPRRAIGLDVVRRLVDEAKLGGRASLSTLTVLAREIRRTAEVLE